MSDADTQHDHADYEVITNIVCIHCGSNETVCAFCGKSMHKCEANRDPRILPGYRVIEEFPDYMINKQATVRHIPSQRYCMLVRVSKTGGAMINLRKNGKPYTRAAQELRDVTFND